MFRDKLWTFPKGMCSPAVFFSHTGLHNVNVAWLPQPASNEAEGF